VIHRSDGIDAEEAALNLTLVAVVRGTRPAVSSAEVAD
jgi:hypothetical protein